MRKVIGGLNSLYSRIFHFQKFQIARITVCAAKLLRDTDVIFNQFNFSFLDLRVEPLLLLKILSDCRWNYSFSPKWTALQLKTNGVFFFFNRVLGATKRLCVGAKIDQLRVFRPTRTLSTSDKVERAILAHGRWSKPVLHALIHFCESAETRGQCRLCY